MLIKVLQRAKQRKTNSGMPSRETRNNTRLKQNLQMFLHSESFKNADFAQECTRINTIGNT